MRRKTEALVPLDKSADSHPVTTRASLSLGGTVLNSAPKTIMIGGVPTAVEANQLIRMIRNITQTIGEYKASGNPLASYAIAGLRKARGDLAMDLEHHFKIHWSVDEKTGMSVFSLG